MSFGLHFLIIYQFCEILLYVLFGAQIWIIGLLPWLGLTIRHCFVIWGIFGLINLHGSNSSHKSRFHTFNTMWYLTEIWSMWLDNVGLTGLTHLDLFGAHITDYGANCFRCKSILQNKFQLWNWMLSYKSSMCSS